MDVQRVHADEEDLLLRIQPESQEAIVSCLGLHWVNDLPGRVFSQDSLRVLYLTPDRCLGTNQRVSATRWGISWCSFRWRYAVRAKVREHFLGLTRISLNVPGRLYNLLRWNVKEAFLHMSPQ